MIRILSAALGAALVACLATCSPAPAMAQSGTAILPQVRNAGGASVGTIGALLVDTTGNPVSIGGSGTSSSTVAQGGSASTATGDLVQGRVVSGDQAYAVDEARPLNLTSTGRLKVGVSYSSNIVPAALPATTLHSALVGCQYRATPSTWLDTWTGSLRCDSSGRLATMLEQPLPSGANTIGSIANTGFIATGNVASGTADSGAPVKTGGVYAANAPSFTDGQRTNLFTDSRGSLVVTLVANGGGVGSPMGAGGNVNDGSANSIGRLVTESYGKVFNGTSWDRWRGDATGAYVVSKGGGSLATAQVSVGATATLLAAARTGRQKITVNVGAANACAFGGSTVTTTTGFPLQPVAGATITLDTAAALYAVCGATTTIGVLEQF